MIRNLMGRILQFFRVGIRWNVVYSVFVLFGVLLSFLIAFMFLTQKNVWWLITAIPEKPRHAMEWVVDRIVEIPYTFKKIGDVQIPEYHITIEKKDYQKLLLNLPQTPDEFLQKVHKKERPATFRFEDQEFDVDVRFRGDGSGHWHWDKKSWRIDFKNKETFDGKKVLHLITPGERGFLIEFFNNYRGKKMGLPVLEDGWAHVYVNGAHHGVYYVSESWGPEFLERNGLGADTNFYGDNASPNPLNPFSIYGDFVDVHHMWKRYAENPRSTDSGFAELHRLFSLMQAEDEVFYDQVWDVVDRESFIDWFVHSKLIGSLHQYQMLNSRLYFDVHTGTFRMVPADVGETPEGFLYYFIGYHPLVDRLLHDNVFVYDTQKVLWEYVSDEDQVEDDLRFYDEAVEKLKYEFYKDSYDEFSSRRIDQFLAQGRGVIVRGLEYVQSILSEVQIAGVLSAESSSGGEIMYSVELSVEHHAPVLLKHIEIEDSTVAIFEDVNGNDVLDDADVRVDVGYDTIKKHHNVHQQWDVELGAVDREKWEDVDNLGFLALHVYEPIQAKRKYFITGVSDEIDPQDVRVEFENIITGENHDADLIYIDSRIFEDFGRQRLSIDGLVAQYSFLRRDGESGVRVAGGTHIIDDVVIIPRGVRLRIDAGTTLLMRENATIISYGAVQALGSADALVRVLPYQNERWGVFAVVDADERSNFIYSHFDGGSDARVNGMYFSGMLAVHRADVSVMHSEFSHAFADDGLNVKYGDANIYDVVFRENSSDGLDFDFVTGDLADSLFVNNGNDAIDVSGTTARLYRLRVDGSGDKCMSIGEGSSPVIFDVHLQGCAIGIEVKDASAPRIVNAVIINNGIGLHAYRKKPLFKIGGQGSVYNSIITGNEDDVVVDEFSAYAIGYSYVEGGFEGENNIDVAPVWVEDRVGFLVDYGKSGQYERGGDVRILEEIGLRGVQHAPIGLYSFKYE